ncbi:hypothetical protein A3B84_01365 [Candidatus Nomurabacteria bacterium RIFCSPHIGHO2_02_FULL_35_13]|uniref:Glycosyl transferase family 17 n=1 Tax=Candidatus Nomurabacteria bacterium RIFCSPHIGHO2_02_FULL_35_13 TaxID=1801748 RepID=A0A1F6VPD3_9BACT|nr:MAG: hypothetical protein UT00_C0018G0006 [Parcubacteria group bacterium GW2011_GWA1_38_7]OGI71510.1 MAG: hypothetical protein A3B84_01365 [Candidatus Nomurabacteria bacterium RIFCSPHIGHO2_02_FULL_35_13]
MKITKNLLMVSNYNADISWILDYTDNYIIYDRSETDEWIKPFDPKKVKKVPNIGWDIYDKFTYIIDNYDNLPETMIMTKGNVFKYITKEEFDIVCNNTFFTPLFTKYHKTEKPIAFYSPDGMYNEINNSWYLNIFPAKYFKTYNDFIWRYVKKIPKYIKFAPGSNYLVTRENILKYPKSFYEELRTYVGYSLHPGEAQIIERVLYYLWSGELDLKLKWQYKVKNYLLAIVTNIIFDLKKIFRKAKNKKIEYYSSYEFTELRKKVKIYDIFTYNGEEELLEIRLNTLNEAVDEFIIVEAPTTFSGLKKTLYFEKQKQRFTPFLHKIKYFVINDYPDDAEILKIADESPNVPKNGPEHWRREFFQKESIKKALTHIRDEDLCFVGDVDEIWKLTFGMPKEMGKYKLRQLVYVYYLNNRSNEPWIGTLLTNYKTIKENCLNHLRTDGKWTVLEGGGWHFTSMGGIEEVRRKLNDSYTKESYNSNDVQSKLSERFGKKDYIGRSKFKFWIDESDLPKYILSNKEKYKNLFKSNEKI